MGVNHIALDIPVAPSSPAVLFEILLKPYRFFFFPSEKKKDSLKYKCTYCSFVDRFFSLVACLNLSLCKSVNTQEVILFSHLVIFSDLETRNLCM